MHFIRLNQVASAELRGRRASMASICDVRRAVIDVVHRIATLSVVTRTSELRLKPPKNSHLRWSRAPSRATTFPQQSRLSPSKYASVATFTKCELCTSLKQAG